MGESVSCAIPLEASCTADLPACLLGQQLRPIPEVSAIIDMSVIQRVFIREWMLPLLRFALRYLEG